MKAKKDKTNENDKKKDSTPQKTKKSSDSEEEAFDTYEVRKRSETGKKLGEEKTPERTKETTTNNNNASNSNSKDSENLYNLVHRLTEKFQKLEQDNIDLSKKVDRLEVQIDDLTVNYSFFF